jgi:hypothetical protein
LLLQWQQFSPLNLIRAVRSLPSRTDREVVARALVPALSETNPKFNTGRFVDAFMGIGSFL